MDTKKEAPAQDRGNSKAQINNSKFATRTPEQVKDVLKFIDPNCSRDEWVKILMGVKAELGEFGEDVAMEWSEPGMTFKHIAFQDTWMSLTEDGGITFGYVVSEAKKNGYKGALKPLSNKSNGGNKFPFSGSVQASRPAPTVDYKTKAADAQKWWDDAQKLTAAQKQEYKDAFGVIPYLAKFNNGKYVIPLADIKGHIQSLQFQDLTGGFENLSGARKKETLIPLNGKVTDTFILAEGYRNACVMQEKFPDQCAISCVDVVNMPVIAKLLKQEYPDAEYVIAADNDAGGSVNAGLEAGRKAQKILKCELVYPKGNSKIDFRDLLLQGWDVSLITKEPWTAPGPVKTISYPAPNGYRCSEEGVFSCGTDEVQLTSAPVWAVYESADSKSDNGKIHLKFKDRRGQIREDSFLWSEISNDARAVAGTLANKGLSTVPGKNKEVVEYLNHYTDLTFKTAVGCPGWLNDSFVLPDRIFNQSNPEIIFEGDGFLGGVCFEQGTLDEWKSGIAEVSPVVQFLIAAALAAPVRHRIKGMEAGGFHIYDTTSKGKTTALQAAASVWGNGVDPANGDSYVQTFNSTGNALNVLAKNFSDIPFIIDEIGVQDSENFGQIIYRLFAGSDRTRLTAGAELKDNQTFRLWMVSSGEIGIVQFISDGGGHAKGGQLARLNDINLDELPALFSSGSEADELKHHCSKQFGTAGRTLLQEWPDMGSGFSDFDSDQIGTAESTVIGRVRKRYGLIAFVGLKAIELGILPWEESAFLASIKQVFSNWKGTLKGSSELARACRELQEFIQGNQFVSPGSSVNVKFSVGWIRDGRFYIRPEQFKTAVGKGVDPVKVKKHLKDLGLLHTTKNLSAVIRVPVSGKNGAAQSISVVAVKEEILEVEF